MFVKGLGGPCTFSDRRNKPRSFVHRRAPDTRSLCLSRSLPTTRFFRSDDPPFYVLRVGGLGMVFSLARSLLRPCSFVVARFSSARVLPLTRWPRARSAKSPVMGSKSCASPLHKMRALLGWLSNLSSVDVCATRLIHRRRQQQFHSTRIDEYCRAAATAATHHHPPPPP